MDKASEDHWRELSEEILTDVKEWRRNHPKATLREIEDEIHTRMNRLEAQLIQDTAQASTSRESHGMRNEMHIWLKCPHRLIQCPRFSGKGARNTSAL